MKKYQVTFYADYKDLDNGRAVKTGERWIVDEEDEQQLRNHVYRELPDLWTPMGPRITWGVREL